MNESSSNLCCNEGSAFVVLKRDGARKFGHVGAAFELANGEFVCFSTDNPNGSASCLAKDKGFWHETVANKSEALELFKGKGYSDYKYLVVNNVDPNQALLKMSEISQLDYNIMNRNCENDVYDVLHDEGSGYGITANANWMFRNNKCYIGWVQEVLQPGPNHWFDANIAATESGTF
mmetsp:Transcript_16036/g.23929  ORF Transcript_16036/g.23929 Transcript_16036/m.23929 type:complete len:177 (-) Transcript_16036:122-652(-)